MSDQDNTDGKRPLGLKGGSARSSGPRKTSVVVEKKRKRITLPTDGAATPKRTVRGAKPAAGEKADAQKPIIQVKKRAAPKKPAADKAAAPTPRNDDSGRRLKTLTDDEREARQKALQSARVADEERKKQEAARKREEEAEAAKRAVTEAREAKKQAEEDAKRQAEAEARQKAETEATKKLEEEERQKAEAKAKAEAEKGKKAEKGKPSAKGAEPTKANEDDGYDRRRAPPTTFRVKQTRANEEAGRAQKAPPADRRKGKLTINQALNEDGGQRERSLASIKRRREREKRQLQKLRERGDKIAREVVVPEIITVSELANRMAERSALVVKTLLDLGVMATVNQSIDADTAQLVVEELGHKPVRVSAADVEEGLTGEVEDSPEDLQPRAPVVTVMGHVDHGKTSLLDAFRKTNVVAGEAGGITQHIGAYQVDVGDSKITFLDTPGHAAFTQMRARGAKVTDLVIVVVASDDGVMPQTIEAINHAKAAEVPLIIAVNKCDLPDANPDRVKQELLQYDVYVESLGGEIQAVDVSATKGTGLNDLLEAIALQAEILELKANPSRPGQGGVIEAQLDKGRGPVATVLVQSGTLNVGDVFVAGTEWGRVRALVNDKGEQVKSAGPSLPVEVLGLQGTPSAGDDFIVVENEARAREVSE
ncbi:MAG: translation initiation factor IF-2, partial [Alphaproteobacteria bacterium]